MGKDSGSPACSDLQARTAAVRNALASQRLEGLEPDALVVEDLQRFARGECEIEDVLARYRARLSTSDQQAAKAADLPNSL